MRVGASSRGAAAASKSLLQRLAELETGLFFSDAGTPDRPVFGRRASRIYSLGTCFGLGFASSCIAGGIALLVLLLVNPVGASEQARSSAESVSATGLVPAQPSPIERQLWWKLPPPVAIASHW
jgi:hypothetical protein